MKQVTDFVINQFEGKFQLSSFRKVPSQASTAGTRVDYSMASGNPSPNFYSGLELTATLLDGNKGLYHGQGTGKKYLTEISVFSNSSPLTLNLCDYLMFYPQIDMDSVDPQYFDNAVSLPRYENGEGVRVFIVAQYPFIGNVTFTVSYTNSDGVSGRSTGVVRMNTTTYIASLIHGGALANSYGCFLPLQSGDKGVRSIENITFASPGGGLGAIVLCKPLCTITTNEVTATSETNFIKDITSVPEIKPGAFLSFLGMPSGSVSGRPLHGTLKFIYE